MKKSHLNSLTRKLVFGLKENPNKLLIHLKILAAVPLVNTSRNIPI